MAGHYPYELKLPLVPYRFVWRDEPTVDAAKDGVHVSMAGETAGGEGGVCTPCP